MRIYEPDRWLVVELTDGQEAYKKVFSGNYGGYTGSDTWKLSSAINETTETDEFFEFKCESGSTYRCHKQSYGMSGYMSSIYSSWEAESGKGQSGVTIKIVEGLVK